MATPLFGSLVTAMVTPFDKELKVDYKRAEELAHRLLDNGTDSLVVCGTTGESPTLTHAEKLEMFRVVKRAVGNRAKVIAGTGNYNTAESIALTQEAEAIGVDGILLVTPYYNKPSQEGLYQHFKAVADSTALPCLLYNIPGRTSREIEPKTICRLAEVKNIVGVKSSLDAFQKVAQVRAGTPEEFMIYSGDDWATLIVLLLGGCGVVSVASHLVGNDIKRMMQLFFEGNVAAARQVNFQLMPLFDALFPPTSPNPCPVKAALRLIGFDCGSVRLPLVEVGEAELTALRKALQRAGAI
ncbi:MAG: 4-hydroxy-tetrahydrodipicolinate synthase [Abditibacteriales bacterium]|nr:4-hydroxy-tetrahydrodipicolinate synthase [Abditibacteriales bacterium]MDW8366024.1 4-hydroxy-tetrahydrodipicolinate synthase [Abditibacteriales bacterium]